MARVLVPVDNTSSWYDELSLISFYYEKEFENILLSHIDTVFPEYIAIAYKKNVTSKNGINKRPDLLLINKNYADWWVVEVETGKDNFTHVKSQVEVFVNGEYNSLEIAQSILEKNSSFDLNLLKNMIRDNIPNVLVIIDEYKEKWVKELKKIKVKTCIFKVFKNTNGTELYSLNGDYPFIFIDESHCKFHKTLPNTLVVHNSQVLDNLNPDIIENNSEISIFYNSRLTRWKKTTDKGQFYLIPIGINSVPINKDYVLKKDTENKLFLKLN